jgi:Bacterial transcriptional activator domain
MDAPWFDAVRTGLLAVYQRVRDRLRDELGADPGVALRHGAFGMLNSTPHFRRGPQTAALLRRMALAAFDDGLHDGSF